MPLQILVCDDEPHIVRAISLKFTRAGFDVMGVSDVESCWRLLHHNDAPDLLFVDDSIPSGGMELVRRIREDQRLETMPIILLTSNDTEPAEQRRLQAKFDIAHIVEKPFSPRELLMTVYQLLGNDSESGYAKAGTEFDRPHLVQNRAKIGVN